MLGGFEGYQGISRNFRAIMIRFYGVLRSSEGFEDIPEGDPDKILRDF